MKQEWRKWKITATLFSHRTVTLHCSRQKNENLSTDVAVSISPVLSPPWKHSPLAPNALDPSHRTKRLVRCWLLYCDPYFDMNVLTRCVRLRHPIVSIPSIIFVLRSVAFHWKWKYLSDLMWFDLGICTLRSVNHRTLSCYKIALHLCFIV